MPVKTFAAIDVGSYEIAMKIYEISAKNGMREIDHLRHSIDMGTETYTTGRLSYERVEELCRILREFKTAMDGYQVIACQAYGTSAFREAENALILLDQISVRTGIKINVLSNSEQRLFHYKSVAWKEEIFAGAIKTGAAIIDIGGGSIQISLFEKDTLVSTQNLRLGVLRLREILNRLDVIPAKYEALLTEIITSQMNVYRKLYLRDRYIENIIVIDDYISDLIIRQSAGGKKGLIDKAALEELLQRFGSAAPAQTAKAFNVPEDEVLLMQISGTLLMNIANLTDAGNIWAPGTTLCDGVAYDYAEKHKIIASRHDFEQDIIACARNISKRYSGSRRRSETMEELALTIFDSMKKVHGLGRRERLLLRIAVLLHDCGKFVSMVNLADCSYNIIMATEIIGLSHIERLIVANVVKYNHQRFEFFENIGQQQGLDRASYMTIAKLTAILRLANGLDRSHKQKFRDMKALVKDGELQLTVDTDKDITLEKGLFGNKARFFEEVFSIRPVIRRKRNSP
ncbi:MAG: HD domain-containing protein [Lachnospiraceae bacterium]|jgi:exopolyphosphatase/guanosine-5'-triphosphate,3'-diphosphate pyrophosphatase|nr:HD domain-containing protein [Lachnospiraceae bacterium]